MKIIKSKKRVWAITALSMGMLTIPAYINYKKLKGFVDNVKIELEMGLEVNNKKIGSTTYNTINLYEIKRIHAHSGFLGSLLGYGTLVLETSNGYVKLEHIENFKGIKDKIQMYIDSKTQGDINLIRTI